MPLDIGSPKQKITVHVLPDVLAGAKRVTGLSTTATIEKALREMNHRWACQELLKLKGKVDFHVSWQEMRSWEDD